MFHDLAHVPAFAGGVALAFAHFRPADPVGRRIGTIVGVAAVLALAIEVVQLATGTGAFELSDLGYDAIGVAVGLAFAHVGLRVWRRSIFDLIVVVGAVGTLFVLPGRDGIPEFEYASEAVERRCFSGPPAPSDRAGEPLPLARYRLDEGGGRIAHDDVGGLDLTIGRPEAVTWAAGGGLEFHGHAPDVRSDATAAALTNAVIATDEVSVEVSFTAGELPQTGPARLATISDGTDFGETNVHVGIEGRAISWRVRTDCDHFNSTFSGHVLEAGRPVHVVATYRPGRATIFVDGEQVTSVPTQVGYLDTWDPDVRLHLGDEATADRRFDGTVWEVALYDRALGPDEVARLAALAG